MKLNQDRRNRARMARGFSLLEMVIVLGIIALILGAAITFSGGLKGAASDTAARAKIREISSKLEAYKLSTGQYPTEQQGLQALVDEPTPVPRRWKQQFRKLPKDPWGADYVYKYPGTKDKRTFELISVGEDGELNTKDDISSQDEE